MIPTPTPPVDDQPAELHELAEIAMGLARIVHQQAQAAATADQQRLAAGQPLQATAALMKLALTFTRLARCIRQIIALQARLAHPATAKQRNEAEIARLKQEVVACLDDAAAGPLGAERPLRDLRERLSDPRIDEATARATVAKLQIQVAKDVKTTRAATAAVATAAVVAAAVVAAPAHQAAQPAASRATVAKPGGRHHALHASTHLTTASQPDIQAWFRPP